MREQLPLGDASNRFDIKDEAAGWGDRRQFEREIFEILKEAVGYQRGWEKEMERQEQKRPESTAHEQLYGRPDIEEKWVKEQQRAFLDWYKTAIVPLRKQQGLDSVGAHGTVAYSLFGPSSRLFDRDQKTGEFIPVGKGILREGLRWAGFGIFEDTEHAGGMGGWWYESDTSADLQDRDDGCWILASPLKAGEDKESTLHHYTIVFTDPRTYVWYLRELQKMVASGETPRNHSAMRLDQLKLWLEEHQGRLPDEVE